MKNTLIRLIILIFGGSLFILFFIYDHNNPPERARVTDLKVGYHETYVGWVFDSPVPASERELQVCGWMEKSSPAELQFTISNPNDINDFRRLDKFFFEIKPGEFCIRLYLLGRPPAGSYILWVMDARHAVGQVSVEFFSE